VLRQFFSFQLYRISALDLSMPKDLLRNFRGDLRAPLPLHPLEKLLLVIVALNVCSLPWMLGGMRPWAQFISLGLSVTAFVVALLPRNYAGNLTRGKDYWGNPINKLIRWPLWWIGLLFFGYVLIQALNPAWEFVQNPESWSMFPVAHIEWLPTGMRTPFEMMNPWRQMMIWGAPFLLICALWIGFTRRKSVINLLTAIVANATVLAVVGIVARYTEPGKILWLVKGVPDYCFSSFIYKNHAGSFFLIMTGIAISLAVWHHKRAKTKRKRSGPSGIFLLMAAVLSAAVLMTYSRGAILILAAFLALTTIVTVVGLIRSGANRETPLLLALLICVVVGFVGISAYLVSSTKTLDRIDRLTQDSHSERSVFLRQYAWQAGLEMAVDRKAAGWGAGGFRFMFPAYQKNYPKIVWQRWRINRDFMFWEHAHNDYLQVLIETGRVGFGILGLGFSAFLLAYARARGFSQHFPMALLASAFLTLAHSWIDFPLQNPAVLLTWSAVLVLALIAAAQERHRRLAQ